MPASARRSDGHALPQALPAPPSLHDLCRARLRDRRGSGADADRTRQGQSRRPDLRFRLVAGADHQGERHRRHLVGQPDGDRAWCWRMRRGPGSSGATSRSTGRRWRCSRRPSAPTASSPSASNWRGCRRPSSEPKEEAGSFSLPVSLSLKEIDLPDIALGPELAGGVASVAAKGSVRAEASPLEVESELNVARTDGRAGNVDASIAFVPDENMLDIDIRASEPQGGIIANLMKLPGEPPVELNVTGSGPAADWAGSGTFAVDGVVVTRVEGRHQFTDKGSAIEAKGDGEFSRFVPEMLRPLLSGKTVFDIAGTATTHGGVNIERATIESNAVRGTASGMIDPEGASDFAFEVAATGDGVPLSFGTEESPIDMIVQSASVRAIGDGSAPNLDIAAALSKVSTNSAELDNLAIALHSDAFNIKSRTGPVTGSLTTAGMTLDNPTIAPLVAGKIAAEFSGTLTEDSLTFDKGSFTSDAISGALNGNVSLADGSITLDLKADVASAALPCCGPPGARRKSRADRKHRARHRRPCFGQPVRAVVRRAGGVGQDPVRQRPDRRRHHGQARRCRAAGQGRVGRGRFRADREGRACRAGCIADGHQRQHRGRQTRNRRAEACGDRQGRCRQSCRRRVADRHGRRRGAGRQGDALHGRRQARGQGPVAGAREEPHFRRSRARREIPAARHRQFPASRCRLAGSARARDRLGRSQRHDQLHRQGRQAGTRRSTPRPPRSRAATSRRRTSTISAVVADYVSAPAISGKVRAATVTSGNDRGARHRRDADARRRLDGLRRRRDGFRHSGKGVGTAPGRRRQDDDRTRYRAGDGSRRQRHFGAALDGRDRRRRHHARQARARPRRRQRRDLGHRRNRAQPQCDARRRARLDRQLLCARACRGRHDFRHRQGHGRSGEPGGRLFGRLDGRADGADAERPVLAR